MMRRMLMMVMMMISREEDATQKGVPSPLVATGGETDRRATEQRRDDQFPLPALSHSAAIAAAVAPSFHTFSFSPLLPLSFVTAITPALPPHRASRTTACPPTATVFLRPPLFVSRTPPLHFAHRLSHQMIPLRSSSLAPLRSPSLVVSRTK